MLGSMALMVALAAMTESSVPPQNNNHFRALSYENETEKPYQLEPKANAPFGREVVVSREAKNL